MIPSYWNDLRVGERRISRRRTITEADLVNFAMFTGDWHPIHTDIEYARADPMFGERIAHGALVLSAALGLVTFWPPAMRAFYGIDKLRFVAPTKIGDTLDVVTTVEQIRPRQDSLAVVTSRFVVRNQHNAEVLVATLAALVAAAPAEGGSG